MREQAALIQNKTVAIYISNSNHYSLLNVILDCLQLYQCQTLLFLPEEMRKHFKTRSNHQVTIIHNTRFTSKKVLKQLNSADFIIIDQLYSFRELISFAFFHIKKPNLLIVHDCNSWFNPQRPISLINKIKNRLTIHIKKKVNYFAVAGENMQMHLQNSLNINNSIVIPFRYADFNRSVDLPQQAYQANTKLIIAVPGMISQRRRYKELLEAVTTKKLKGKIQLVLLGKPKGEYGAHMLQLIKEKIEKGHQIKYWTAFIPDQVFNEEIKKAHILFSDFNPVYHTDNGQVEIYGITKETGISLLMLNKAKPGLLPSTFKQMASIENQTLHYSSLDHLAEILYDLYQGNSSLEKLIYHAIQNAETMKIEKVAAEIAKAYALQTTHE